MPQFILNTAGSVEKHKSAPWAEGDNAHPAPGQVIAWTTWDKLDAFTQGYIEALFFTWPEDEGDFIGGITSPAFSDLAPETLAKIVKDCAEFQRTNAALLAQAYQRRDYDAWQAGRDYWFTRNGHGVGYWDRDALKPSGPEWEATQIPLDQWTPEMRATRERLKAESLGELLSAACRHSEVDAYLGDDGKVYL